MVRNHLTPLYCLNSLSTHAHCLSLSKGMIILAHHSAMELRQFLTSTTKTSRRTWHTWTFGERCLGGSTTATGTQGPAAAVTTMSIKFCRRRRRGRYDFCLSVNGSIFGSWEQHSYRSESEDELLMNPASELRISRKPVAVLHTPSASVFDVGRCNSAPPSAGIEKSNICSFVPQPLQAIGTALAPLICS